MAAGLSHDCGIVTDVRSGLALAALITLLLHLGGVV